MELTNEEKLTLNEISMQRSREVLLGDMLEASPMLEFGTPVKRVRASLALTVSGVVVHGETITVSNPAAGEHVRDNYEFLTTDAQVVTEVGNIAINISTHAVKATGLLSVEVQPVSGETIKIGAKTYTFVPVGTDTADGEVSIGADLAGAQANIIAAVNGTDEFNDPNPWATIGEFVSDDAIVTALIGGTSGNTVDSEETMAHTDNHFGAAHLAGGTNCSVTNAVDHLVAEITTHDTQGVGATDTTGGVVSFIADAFGVAGNDIVVGEVMANGAFAGAATKLAGGVDGTAFYDGKMMLDTSYLYIYVEDLVDWRRMTLGSAY